MGFSMQYQNKFNIGLIKGYFIGYSMYAISELIQHLDNQRLFYWFFDAISELIQHFKS